VQPIGELKNNKKQSTPKIIIRGVPLKTDSTVAKRGCETIQIKDVLKNFLHSILKKSKNADNFLKKIVIEITRFLYRSRKTIRLVTVIFFAALIFNVLIVFWINNNANNYTNDNENNIPAKGTIYVKDLEIYGENIKSEAGKLYVDWGELYPGASTSTSFNVQIKSNVDVKLELNVTGWTPAKLGSYIKISWDYNGTQLSPQQELPVTLYLNIPSSEEFIRYLVENQITAFGFDININASGL